MWKFLIILAFLSAGMFFVCLIFGLMRAGRRADEGEEKLLDVMAVDPDGEEGRSL